MGWGAMRWARGRRCGDGPTGRVGAGVRARGGGGNAVGAEAGVARGGSKILALEGCGNALTVDAGDAVRRGAAFAPLAGELVAGAWLADRVGSSAASKVSSGSTLIKGAGPDAGPDA